ncbi:MAG: hypothetical protein FH756_11430 [Firmicutes bacterium]|nr:hypothetical protein [Bacillota bacterium]
MLAIVKSVALHGLEGHIKQVEVDVSNRLPACENVSTYSRHKNNPAKPGLTIETLFSMTGRRVGW